MNIWIWLALGCASKPSVSVPTTAPAVGTSEGEAAAGVHAPALAALVQEHWDATMRRWPTWASDLGDHRYDALVGDVSLEARAAWTAKLQSLRTRIAALTDLDPADTVTARMLDAEINASLLEATCGFDDWQFSARDNPLVTASSTAELTELKTAEDAANWVARIEAFTAQLPVDLENRRRGVKQGRTATQASVKLVLEQVREVANGPVEAFVLTAPPRALPESLPESVRTASIQRTEIAAAAYQQALLAWADAIEAEVLPVARGDDAPPGLTGIPGGEACYTAMIEHHTSLSRTADEIHQTGLDEIARLQGEVAMLGKKAADKSDVQAIFQWLRTDPGLYFETEDQVEDAAKQALTRATAAIPQWFGTLPKTPCNVERIPAYLAPYTTIAYYQPLAVGERPGTYFINTYAPTTRPRHEAEVLAFHESIPGHHLQIALGQEQAELPLFRRHGQTTAFVEGWGLYSEQLADEMGLYSSDTDRFGMYSFELWRASRLVVDTGLHAKGWSREQAIEYMVQNTPLARNNIVNEVDRYINTPGQALAYKVGQLEIWKLRREAEAALGPAFDIKAFHDVVLGAGAVTLPVLRTRVEAWIAEQGSAPQ